MKELEERCEPVAGALAAAHARIRSPGDQAFTLLAGQWRSSSKHKVTFLSTAFSFAPATTPYISANSQREVPQTVIGEKWYGNYGAVDAFNHTIVGDGESSWIDALTLNNKRNFPMVTGALSIIDAQVFNALKFFYDYKETHVQFRRELATALINNPYRGDCDDANWVGQPREETHIQLFAPTRGRCVMCSNAGVRSDSQLYCSLCGPSFRLCRDRPETSHRNARTCWSDHIRMGIPARTRTRKNDYSDASDDE
jgi:hypothetical protein